MERLAGNKEEATMPNINRRSVSGDKKKAAKASVRGQQSKRSSGAISSKRVAGPISDFDQGRIIGRLEGIVAILSKGTPKRRAKASRKGTV